MFLKILLTSQYYNITHSYYYHFPSGYSNDVSSGGKGYTENLESTADCTAVPTASVPDMDQSDLGYLTFDSQGESATDVKVSKHQPESEESLRESLKKRLEFCLSR